MYSVNNLYSNLLKIYFSLIFINEILCLNEEFCEIPKNPTENVSCGKWKHVSNKRYILYDVNPSEGFNLRRDVYVRMAVFIRNLNQADPIYMWNLVLPPWDHLYHWRSQNIGVQSQIPWGKFYDVPSLRSFIPVIEMHHFFKDYESTDGDIMLDRVFVLQSDPEMFKSGDFRDRNEITPCNENGIKFRKIASHKFKGPFWGYPNITAKDVQCLLFHGTASNLIQNLEPKLYNAYMFDHAEIPLHDFYGSREFWRARRSMRFHPELYEIARHFRKKYLNSTDGRDRTVRPQNWLDEKEQREAMGGPYLGVHWRRRDFLIGRSASVPSIENAALQLREKMKRLELQVVFIATDGEDHEFNELKQRMGNYQVVRYMLTDDVKQKLQDGGIAIIDQIICSHARYFIGTYESTFTFRIQEEREIIGFPAKTTFNNLCWKDGQCSSQSQWKIAW